MRLILTIFMCWVCALAYAGDFDKVVMKITTVSTNATVSQAESSKIEGFIERVDGYLSSTGAPYVKIISSNDITHVSTDVMSDMVRGTNFSFYPRIQYQHVTGVNVGTNGAIGRILMSDEKLYLIATNATPGYDLLNLTAVVIFEQK